MCDFGEGIVLGTKHSPPPPPPRQGFCYSQEADVTTKDVSAFLDMRKYKNWAHKIGS